MEYSSSGQVNYLRPVIFITLHVLTLDQHINLLFDHLGVCTEHSNISDDIVEQVLVPVCLLGLHYFDCVCLDYKCALSLDLSRLFLFLR